MISKEEARAKYHDQSICDIGLVSDATFDALYQYVEKRLAPGQFLMGVLENNLMTAAFHADIGNRIGMSHLAKFIYWEVPEECWGSQTTVESWLRNIKMR